MHKTLSSVSGSAGVQMLWREKKKKKNQMRIWVLKSRIANIILLNVFDNRLEMIQHRISLSEDNERNWLNLNFSVQVEWRDKRIVSAVGDNKDVPFSINQIPRRGRSTEWGWKDRSSWIAKCFRSISKSTRSWQSWKTWMCSYTQLLFLLFYGLGSLCLGLQ